MQHGIQASACAARRAIACAPVGHSPQRAVAHCSTRAGALAPLCMVARVRALTSNRLDTAGHTDQPPADLRDRIESIPGIGRFGQRYIARQVFGHYNGGGGVNVLG